MQSHQQRVVNELSELENKIRKLTDFILSDKFIDVVADPEERNRLITQNSIMNAYANILQERIDNFN